MSNTRIILNRQSDLKLTGAEILAPIGIEKSDLPGLVEDLQQLQQAIDAEVNRAQNKDADHDNVINQLENSINDEAAIRIAADASLEFKYDDAIKKVNADFTAADTSLESKVDDSIKKVNADFTAADASLESKVNIEKDRIDAILSAATADTDSFAEIVTLINSVDTENDQAFAGYVLSNDAALSTEESARIAGDASLESKLSVDMSTEVSARTSADSSLESKLSVDMSTEVSARTSADSSLESKLNSDISTEVSAREAADRSLESYILDEVEELSQARVVNSIAISAEESSRIAADASLESKLSVDMSTEVSARTSADTSLESKVDDSIKKVNADFTAADASLESKVNIEKDRIDAILSAATADTDSFAEIVTLINSVDTENDQAFAGYVLSNDAALSTEVAAREAAISAEESTRLSIDEAIKAGVNNALVEIKGMLMNATQNGSFMLLFNDINVDGVTTTFGAIMNGRGAIYLNGLLQHEDVDYTTNSFVDGKGNPNFEFIFNTAPEAGSSVAIYGQPGEVANSNWFGTPTPLV